MSKFTDYFPASTSGGGSGGGILKQHIITSSGTIDLTTLGIADGDLIQVFLVGGGEGAGNAKAGRGGNVLIRSTTIGTAGTATVTIGAGGLAVGFNPNPGGATTISGGGLSPSLSSNSTGTTPGGALGTYGTAGATSGNNAGFGQGGGGGSSDDGPINSGNGGNAIGSNGGGGDGGSGIAIIFYS